MAYTVTMGGGWDGSSFIISVGALQVSISCSVTSSVALLAFSTGPSTLIRLKQLQEIPRNRRCNKAIKVVQLI